MNVLKKINYFFKWSYFLHPRFGQFIVFLPSFSLISFEIESSFLVSKLSGMEDALVTFFAPSFSSAIHHQM
jgi:hypothetical protein